MAQPVENLKAAFADLKYEQIDDLKTVYSEDVVFIDPFERFSKRNDLLEYFRRQYEDVIECRFDYLETVVQENQAFVTWVMVLRHKKLASGATLRLEGCSHLKFDAEKVIYHRDFYDSNEFIFENIPIIGRGIKWAKSFL